MSIILGPSTDSTGVWRFGVLVAGVGAWSGSPGSRRSRRSLGSTGSTGFVVGLVLGRTDRLARIFEPYIIAFNSLPRIALVPLVTMIFGFGLLAKVVLAWLIASHSAR